ncbi:MAG: TIGR00730 family Rossman fold protein [Burkholderiales bacterium]
MRRICVFCGSNAGARSEFAEAARALAAVLVERKLGIVYGGGNVGMMGVLADAALERGGEVTGVIPRTLVDKEVAHRGVTELLIVETMHERKARMNDLSDAFIALPGGFGTLDEFFEVLTWSQLGFHGKPCALLNVAGYYDRMLAMLDHAVAERFLRPAHRELVIADTDPSRLLQRLSALSPAPKEKWDDAKGNFL